jgi:peptide/nickel transport system substrate-binding protein
MKRRRLGTYLGVIVSSALAIALAACSSPGSSSSSQSASKGGSAASGTLTIDNEEGALWTCGFNPFNPAVNGTANGFIYEPLIYVNTLESGKTTPWLASSFAWSDGNKVLTFTIRKGVKWSDGKPLTAADVAFTFDEMKKYPSLDLNAVWSVLSSVTQNGDQVVLTFKKPGVPYFYYVADQTFIVPEHIWSTIKNPTTYANAKPVGSGPYEISNCTPQNISYAANTHYWQPGLPKIAKVEFPAFTSNSAANSYLATGQAQWAGQFVPSVKTFYLDKSPDNQFWAPPIADLSLFLNQTVAPLNDVAVRQAMAYAIDRQKVAAIGEYGYQPASNQSAIVTPTFSSWLDTSLAAQYNYGYYPSKAASILEKDGYTKGANGIFSKNGKPLAFTIINEGGNTDWVADLQIIQRELTAAGIKITVDNLATSDFLNDLYKGNYQIAYNFESGGPGPYYELRQALYSKNSAPIGQTAATNWERWQSPATDNLISEYASTTSVSVQHTIVDQLQKVMLADVPIIPITAFVDWYEHNTSQFTGWPTQANPYAQPAPYNTPDDEQVLLHLAPK